MLRYSRKWIGLSVYPFFVFTLFCNTVFGQSKTDNQAYQAALNLEFEKARELSSSATDIPYFNLYIQNLNDVLELIFNGNKERYEQLSSNEDERLSFLEDQPESAYRNFFLAEIKLQWAFVRLKFGYTWNGVWNLRKAYKLTEDNIEAYPDFIPNYKTMGLLHVVFGAVPDGQKWVLNILGLEGNVSQGLKELEKLSESNSDFTTETRLISALTFCYLLENNEKALAQFQNFSKPLKTKVEVYAEALVLMKAHKAQEAAQLLEYTLENENEKNAGQNALFYYVLGESLFQGGEYSEALSSYQAFLNAFKGLNYRKDALLKITLCHYHLGDPEAFQKTWQQAKNYDTGDTEADRNAEKILNAEKTNFELLSIRYAIDGGYFTKAAEIIKSLNTSALTQKEKLEVEYRKARMAQLQKKNIQALRFFKKVIDEKEHLQGSYFVPNAYLQMGYIYVELQKYEEATSMFNEVLAFKKHPYKNSLDSKAKIALKTIDDLND